MQQTKLYRLTPGTFRLPSYVDDRGRLHTIRADSIPFLRWPDGSWCVPGSLYMLDLFHRGLSRKNGGGTLFTYATNISHLLRFCWKHRIDPIDLTDDRFTEFILKLSDAKRLRRPEVARRNANSVIAIGRCSLDFLASVGRYACDSGFVGTEGRIHCEQREYVVRTARGGTPIVQKYWHHRAFPAPDPMKRRMSIGTELIDRLRAAVEPASKSTHLRKRRYVTIKLLEITGGRRAEIAGITVEAVRAALGMESPMLLIPTLKKRSGLAFRLLPIHPHDARFLLDYVEVNRARVVRKTIGATNDHGLLLINGRTGGPLKPGTITKELRFLAAEAGITVQACPHMFRHRFITKIYVALIEAHNCTNEDEFRRLLIDSHAMQEKILEWTGQADVASMRIYLHLAFDEVAKFKRTYDLVSTKLKIESFFATIDQTTAELANAQKNGEAQAPIFEGFVRLLSTFRNDLEGLGKSS